MRKINIAGIGLLIFFVGIYIFPFGMELLYWGFLHIYGDFWRATIAIYSLSVLLMVAGIAIASHKVGLGPFNFIKSPIFIMLVIVITLGIMFAALPR